MTTKSTIALPENPAAPKLEIDKSEWDDGEEFCIMDRHRTDFSLCGLHLPDEVNLPDDEVPNEVTCKDCLEIYKARKRK